MIIYKIIGSLVNMLQRLTANNQAVGKVIKGDGVKIVDTNINTRRNTTRGLLWGVFLVEDFKFKVLSARPGNKPRGKNIFWPDMVGGV